MAQDNWTHTDPDRGVQYTAADLTKTWPDPWAGSWTGSTTTTSSPVTGGTLYHNKNITNITGMPPRHDPAADPGTLCATDIKLQGLGSVKELLTQMEFLTTLISSMKLLHQVLTQHLSWYSWKKL